MRWALLLSVTTALTIACKGIDFSSEASKSSGARDQSHVCVRGIALLGQAAQHTDIAVSTTSGGFVTKTDASGNFSFLSMPPETYDFRFEKSGYETARMDSVTVSSTGADFVLETVTLNPIDGGPYGSLLTADGSTTIYRTDVELLVSASEGAVSMRFAEAKVFDVAPWQQIAPRISYTFSKPGEHEILYAFKDAQGLESMPASLRLQVIIGSGSWRPMSTNGAPTARASAYAAWTGKSLLVWGGMEKEKTSNTGAFYDPDANTWTAISSVGAPKSRAAGAFAWTGDALLVWGGFHSDSFRQKGSEILADGAIYRPSTNSWTPMSANGAPEARYSTANAWNGTELIIWGGSDYSDATFHRNGALYNPTSDSWRPMATLGSPSPRIENLSVWTGAKLIVWGGKSQMNQLLNDGAMYDPQNNSWTALSAEGAPSPRVQPLAVWTGEKMIVWSGWVADLRDGAIYDPKTNAWTSIPALGAPSSRTTLYPVWNGKEMIIWGGNGDAQALLDDGVIFNPQSGKWSLTNSIGAPQARAYNITVWTGKEMIVWGGIKKLGVAFGEDDLWNDGAIFTP